jgi:hypothetical protein
LNPHYQHEPSYQYGHSQYNWSSIEICSIF